MGETISLRSDDGVELGAYRAAPEGTPRGGIVVVQEIFGVNHHIRSVVDRYAGFGYLAVAPALFDRVERGVELDYDGDGIAKGREIVGELPLEATLADITAAAASVADAGRTGIVGYCWGGKLTYVAATRLSEHFAAGSGYYGGGIVEFAGETPRIPLQLHFGAEDHAIPLDAVNKIREAQPDVEVFVYDGAGHGFNCDARDSYDPVASALAQERTNAHFAAHVG
ncbi:MAG: dienelactone hydrolase family protein [Actinomycetota bacterium]|nr:dienelactone hydrolase family protein [Actinomycetota bacterium]